MGFNTDWSSMTAGCQFWGTPKIIPRISRVAHAPPLSPACTHHGAQGAQGAQGQDATLGAMTWVWNSWDPLNQEKYGDLLSGNDIH